jgi:hypothetical protein
VPTGRSSFPFLHGTAPGFLSSQNSSRSLFGRGSPRNSPFCSTSRRKRTRPGESGGCRLALGSWGQGAQVAADEQMDQTDKAR